MTTPTLEMAISAASGGLLHTQALARHVVEDDQRANTGTEGSQRLYRPRGSSSGVSLDDLND